MQTLLNDTRYFVYEVETTPLDEKQEKLNRITKDVSLNKFVLNKITGDGLQGHGNKMIKITIL